MARRSPTLKPCLLSDATMHATRSLSSPKVERVPAEASAVRSGYIEPSGVRRRYESSLVTPG